MNAARVRQARMLEAAKAYAARGWHIFPCVPVSKQPLTPDGFKAATIEPGQVMAWWTMKPTAGIGLVPGPSGLVVFDLDRPEAEATAQRLGLLSEPTLTCATGRRGYPIGHPKHFARAAHLYFNTAGLSAGLLERIGNRKVDGVLEVKAFAGYTLLPPSLHDSGITYTWEVRTAPVCLPPLALAALEQLAATGSSAPAPVPDTITEGSRDSTLASIAGALRRRGCSAGVIQAALTGVNRDCCRPPLSDRDIERISQSIERYPPAVQDLAITRPPAKVRAFGRKSKAWTARVLAEHAAQKRTPGAHR